MPFLKLKEVGMRETCAWIAVGPLGHYCVSCPTMSQLGTFAPFVPPTFDQKSTSCRQGNPSTWILYFKTDRMSFDYYVSCLTVLVLLFPLHSLTKNITTWRQGILPTGIFISREIGWVLTSAPFWLRAGASVCKTCSLCSQKQLCLQLPAERRYFLHLVFFVLHSLFCSEEILFIFLFFILQREEGFCILYLAVRR